METYGTGPVEQRLELDSIRRVAVRAAEAGLKAVLVSQLLALSSDDALSVSTDAFTYMPGHAGDAPIPLDAAAREAVRDVILRELPALVGPARLHEGGEESGGGTTVLRSGDIIYRTDDLDGSTNADCLLNNYSSVVTIDVIREPKGDKRRARHLAGAIALATGLTVSWVNESRWLPGPMRHASYRGRVYISGDSRGIPEVQIGDARWDRRERTFAGVASKPARYEALVAAIVDPRPTDVIYNVGGTPIVAGLIAGAIDQVIEVQPTTLHDTAHLIPHQLLGGKIMSLDGNDSVDYLALYERETLDLNPNAKPVPPFIAQGGGTR